MAGDDSGERDEHGQPDKPDQPAADGREDGEIPASVTFMEMMRQAAARAAAPAPGPAAALVPLA